MGQETDKHDRDEARGISGTVGGIRLRSFLRAWVVLSGAILVPGLAIEIALTTGCNDSFHHYVLEWVSRGIQFLSPVFWLLCGWPELWGTASDLVMTFAAFAVGVTSTLIPSLIWAYATTTRLRRPFLRAILPTAGVALLVILVITYPSWQKTVSQTHRMYHRSPCKGNLEHLWLRLQEELVSRDGSTPFTALRSSLRDQDGERFFRALKAALLAEKWLVTCPELKITCPGEYAEVTEKRLTGIAESSSLAELKRLIGYNLNTSPASSTDPLLWDRQDNHRCCDSIVVLFCDGITRVMKLAELRERYPTLSESNGPC